jgi:hypothetical protein
MPRTQEIKKLLRAVADNPELLRGLLTSQGPEDTKRALSDARVLPQGYPEFHPREVAEEIERILRDDGFNVHIKAPEGRVVEWVAAIGTAAAGAMAAV